MELTMSSRLLALVTLVSLVAACSVDSTPPRKDGTSPVPDQLVYCSLTCSGCCAPDGSCQTGDSPTACGSGGTPCIACGTGQTCTNQICGGGLKDLGTNDKPAGSCATTCSGCCVGETCVSAPTDAKCGTKGAACVDCTTTGKVCSAGVCETKCTFEGGCGDNTKWCDVGKCVACATGKFNCDNKWQCECDGGCNGTSCTGTTSCDYYDQNVCGGDTSKWCWNNACTSCSAGWFNCNKTKGCECDSAGCNGTACAGKCSGGEC
jgi:hypothetical protein